MGFCLCGLFFFFFSLNCLSLFDFILKQLPFHLQDCCLSCLSLGKPIYCLIKLHRNFTTVPYNFKLFLFFSLFCFTLFPLLSPWLVHSVGKSSQHCHCLATAILVHFGFDITNTCSFCFLFAFVDKSESIRRALSDPVSQMRAIPPLYSVEFALQKQTRKYSLLKRKNVGDIKFLPHLVN